MAKEFKVLQKERTSEDPPETLVYNRRYGGYLLDSSRIMIKLLELSHDEFMEYKAGDLKQFFPEYDPTVHSIETLTYDESCYKMKRVPLGLFKYKQPDETEIPYGCFVFEQTNSGTLLRKVDPSSDEFLDLNHKFDLHNDFNVFRSRKKFWKSKGQRCRKGLLFYGPPGNGKTAQITQLCKHSVKEKFRVFFVDKKFDLTELIQFKKIFEKDDSVFVIEEITERVGGRGTEELLSFMDGEMSWNNSYIIATTNHPETLPWNIIDRPSRFKVKLEFDNPNESERRLYLQKMNVDETLIEEAVKATDGLSLDYIKNITLDSFIEGKTIPELIKEYKSEKSKISNNFKKTKIGL